MPVRRLGALAAYSARDLRNRKYGSNKNEIRVGGELGRKAGTAIFYGSTVYAEIHDYSGGYRDQLGGARLQVLTRVLRADSRMNSYPLRKVRSSGSNRSWHPRSRSLENRRSWRWRARLTVHSDSASWLRGARRTQREDRAPAPKPLPAAAANQSDFTKA